MNTGRDGQIGPGDEAGLSRRDFLKSGVSLAGATALGGLLSSCSSTGANRGTLPSSSSGSSHEKPKRGGTFRFGLTGGTSSDTLDPLRFVSIVDSSRYPQLYDPLVGLNSQAQPTLVLAKEITPNADATKWTIRVHRGVTFHNGKEFTADDVIYLFQISANPKAPVDGTNLVRLVDPTGLKKLDKYTVQVPCRAPFATLIDSLASYYFSVIPEGYNPKSPNGTGPFKFKSFTPGQQSTFVRNENYWQTGLPYFDSVVITDFTDEASQVNALSSGQVDGIGLLTAPSITTVTAGGGKVAVGKGGEWNPFTMRVDLAPFKDVRVREALKLVVDRKEMLNLLFGGHGLIGNDLFAIWDHVYDHSLPQREQDLGKARFLLKKAGQEGLSLQLVTSNIAQGIVRAAQVYAQQASGAGIKVALQQVTPSDFFGPEYLKWSFAQDEWIYFPYFPQVALANLPNAPFNETHYADPRYLGLYQQALRTVDVQKRTRIAHDMQSIFYDTGGYIVPAFVPTIDGYANRLRGLKESKVGLPFDNFNFKELWFA
jgi:peptide/nickel transport system substrate-binding protein